MVVGIPLDGVAVVLNSQLIVLFGKGLISKPVQTKRGPSEKSIAQTMLPPRTVLSLFEFVRRLSAHGCSFLFYSTCWACALYVQYGTVCTYDSVGAPAYVGRHRDSTVRTVHNASRTSVRRCKKKSFASVSARNYCTKGINPAPSGKLADSSRDILRDVVRARAKLGWLARFTPPK
jgi:hypothetical protein